MYKLYREGRDNSTFDSQKKHGELSRGEQFNLL